MKRLFAAYWRPYIFVMIASITINAPIFYFVLDRNPPIVPSQGKMTPDQVTKGQEVLIDWYVDVRRICPGVVHREIVDSARIIYRLESIPSVLSANDFHVVRRFTIPTNLNYGPAKYRVTVDYTCNITQRPGWWPISVRSPDMNFTVTP